MNLNGVTFQTRAADYFPVVLMVVGYKVIPNQSESVNRILKSGQ